MPKVSEEYRVARRDEIAQAALRAFRRGGFQGTSMAEIIAESGLSAGAIYGHYPSKSAIVVDVATRVVGARVADIRQLADLEPLPAPPTIPRLLIERIRAELGDPSVLLQLWGAAVTEPELRTLVLDVIVRLKATLADYVSLWHQRTHGTPADDADALAAAQVPLLIAAVHSYVVQSSVLPNFDTEAYLDSIETYLPR